MAPPGGKRAPPGGSSSRGSLSNGRNPRKGLALGEDTRPWLLTGSTGFVGHHVLDEATRRQIPIRALVRSAHRAIFGRDGVEWFEGDLRDPGTVGRAAAGIRGVIHVAGLTRGRARDLDAVNRDGVANLVKASLSAAADLTRFLHVSSLAAGGPGTPTLPRSEDARAEPITDYGRSKLAGEEVLKNEGASLPWTIVRPPIVYGPWERDLYLMFKLARRRWVPASGSSEAKYSVVYGPDLAAAIWDLAVHPRAAGKVINVAENRAYTTAEMVAAMGRGLGTRPRTIRLPDWGVKLAASLGSAVGSFRTRPPLLSRAKLPEILAPGWVAATNRLRELLPLACQTSFEEGAARTIQWYRAEGWL